MLRLAVAALLLANAGYYAWTQGFLAQFGLAPEEQSEPQRMNQQIRPETLQILRVNPSKPSAPPPAPAAAPPAPTGSQSAAPAPADATAAAAADTAECLQAGVFDDRQAEALRTAAAAGLPAGSWVMDPTPIPGRWMVYMGRFDDIETLDRKRAELRARKVDHDRAGGTLEFGLSLGRFSTKDAAERELASLNTRGVRTARVIQERPDSPGFTLRLPSVNDALRARLDTLRTAMAGKTLRTCA
ncbi:SPOR domain-containing protein [Acidovorax sp. RAC01]|uniref:SPOR domain-containing protein n=1 Tax=Acidovorax sp. RAC01 TaxID=1842533 RepID=UPI00083E8814|nr:SPOR domain-containing protein [Acidovorax sp. RAC01]AOG24957.1 sporulation related domain protein [Acidovorax sp. RAC01]